MKIKNLPKKMPLILVLLMLLLTFVISLPSCGKEVNICKTPAVEINLSIDSSDENSTVGSAVNLADDIEILENQVPLSCYPLDLCGKENSAELMDSAEKEFALETFKIVNKLRTDNGFPELLWDDDLYVASKRRSLEIKEHFSHYRPNGLAFFTAVSELGINWMSASEMIAAGYSSPQEAVDAWLSSPIHKASIFSANTYIAVGISKFDKNMHYGNYAYVLMLYTPG